MCIRDRQEKLRQRDVEAARNAEELNSLREKVEQLKSERRRLLDLSSQLRAAHGDYSGGFDATVDAHSTTEHLSTVARGRKLSNATAPTMHPDHFERSAIARSRSDIETLEQSVDGSRGGYSQTRTSPGRYGVNPAIRMRVEQARHNVMRADSKAGSQHWGDTA